MADNLFDLPDEKLKEKIWSELGLNRRKIQEAVEMLKEWMQQQPHLPEDYDERRLERFLLDCKNRMENTKATLDLYYTLKNLCPDFMSGWDVRDKWLQNIKNAVYGYTSKQLTSEGDRVSFLAFTKEVDKFDIIALGKVTVLYMEIRKLEDYWRSNVVVVDFRNFSIAHIPKMTLPLMRKLEVVLIKAYKYRIKALHFLNVTPYAEIIINVIKSIMKSKIAARIQIHGSDLTEFYKQVPKALLPTDFGGEGESVAENNERWMNEVQSKRDWFLEREKIKSDETKRPGKTVDSSDIFGFEGTFRKLDVD